MTMKGARDDDDGCWEKGKPVRDDLSEPVWSNIGICLSFLQTTSFTSCISFLFYPLAVFLEGVCLWEGGKRIAREALSKVVDVEAPHLVRYVKAR